MLGTRIHAFNGGAGMLLWADHLLSSSFTALFFVVIYAVMLLWQAMKLAKYIICKKKKIVQIYNFRRIIYKSDIMIEISAISPYQYLLS